MASGGGDITEALLESDIISSCFLDSSTLSEAEAKQYFARFPERARHIIWKYLTFTDLTNFADAYPEFKNEMLPVFRPYFPEETDDEDWSTNFLFKLLILNPVIPLYQYLDASSRETLRLVCKEMKSIVDYCEREQDLYVVEESNSNENISLPSASASTCSASILAESSKTTIFDLYVDNLKRICSYLSNQDLESFENVCKTFSRLVKEVRKYPFTEYRNTSDINLLDLPNEILEKVFGFIPNPKRANVRLVSTLMQLHVDSLAGISVFLNDTKWINESLLEKIPPASSLIVTNVEDIESIVYFVSEFHCRLLTRLTLDGPFLPEAFLLILKLCSNLKYIGLTFALKMGSIEDELNKSKQQGPLELKSLTSVNLKVQEKDLTSNVLRSPGWTWLNAFEFMKSNLLLIPNMTSFYLCENAMDSHSLMYEVADQILKFIVDHQTTLKYVEVILNGNCLRTCMCPVYVPKISNQALEGLNFIKYSYDCDWRICRPFRYILECQNSLQVSSCLELSDWEFYAGIIAQNKQTLKSVTIEKSLSPVIDLMEFSVCASLEYLRISRCGSPTVARQLLRDHIVFRLQFDPHLINIKSLPLGLKSLHILDFNVEPSELELIPKRLKNLETLELQFVGEWNGSNFGLTAQTIMEIIQLRKLNSLFLEDIQSLPLHPTFIELESVFLRKNNMIPEGCFHVNDYKSKFVVFLIVERMPSADFMPEWRSEFHSEWWQMHSRCSLPKPSSSTSLIAASTNYLSEDMEEEEAYDEDDNDESSVEYDDDIAWGINPDVPDDTYYN